VHARGNQVRLAGAEDRVKLGREVLEQLYGLLREGRTVAPSDVHSAIQAVAAQPGAPLREVYTDVLSHVGSRRRIAAKNLSQRRYIELIESTTSSSRLAPRAPARPTSPWPWRSPR